MNILHLLSWCPNPDDPTLGNFCIRQINALPDECHSIILSAYEDKNLTSGYEIREEENERYRMIRVHYAPRRQGMLRKISIIKMYNIGLQYITKKYFTPDLIHLHVAYPLGIIALLWKWKYGFKYILTEHWTIYQPQNAAMLKGFMKKVIVKTGNKASTILPVSLDLQRNMEQIGIKNQYKVVYNLVDTSTFTLSHPQNAKKRMLHISTLRDEAKNFSGILRTIKRLRQPRDDFELHVIHDYDAPEFKAFVAEHNLTDCVFFHGKKTSQEVAEFFSNADFFVLFSNLENLPCVIVESFASGVPVISTNVGGIAEILSPERGILINQGDEEALLQSLNQMLDHSADYDREAIRKYAIENFSAKKIGNEIYEQYLNICKQ